MTRPVGTYCWILAGDTHEDLSQLGILVQYHGLAVVGYRTLHFFFCLIVILFD